MGTSVGSGNRDLKPSAGLVTSSMEVSPVWMDKQVTEQHRMQRHQT